MNLKNNSNGNNTNCNLKTKYLKYSVKYNEKDNFAQNQISTWSILSLVANLHINAYNSNFSQYNELVSFIKLKNSVEYLFEKL